MAQLLPNHVQKWGNKPACPKGKKIWDGDISPPPPPNCAHGPHHRFYQAKINGLLFDGGWGVQNVFPVIKLNLILSRTCDRFLHCFWKFGMSPLAVSPRALPLMPIGSVRPCLNSQGTETLSKKPSRKECTSNILYQSGAENKMDPIIDHFIVNYLHSILLASIFYNFINCYIPFLYKLYNYVYENKWFMYIFIWFILTFAPTMFSWVFWAMKTLWSAKDLLLWLVRMASGVFAWKNNFKWSAEALDFSSNWSSARSSVDM